MSPLPEQVAIAAYQERETIKIDTLVAKVQEAKMLLKKHRTALVSVAVTCETDVQGLAG